MTMFFLSGLPRTGSTLLSSILSQNPNIHAEGNSAVCQLMWDMQVSFETNSKEQISCMNKEYLQDEIISKIPNMYYNKVNRPIIVDKSRAWAKQPNIELILRYITKKPKILVLVRPVDEIKESFRKLYKANKQTKKQIEASLNFAEYMINDSLYGVRNADEHTHPEYFHFIFYKDLVEDTPNTIDKIYEFLEIEKFNHDFDNIVNIFPEDDTVYGLNGMHSVRSVVGYK